MTTLLGTNAALSRSFLEFSGSLNKYGKIASFQSHCPAIDFA
jgi:hypothetical protein